MEQDKIILFQDLSKARFKSERLRKVIKASLTEEEISFGDNKFDQNIDVVHLLYPFTSSQFNIAYDNNKKIILSLFYSEGEEEGRCTDISKVFDLKKATISNSLLQMVYKADMTLVPYEEYKKFLIDKGVEPSKITVLPAGANYKIYKYLPEDNMALARRYFGFNENEKIILAFGNYDDKECVDKLYKLAELRPDCKVVYLVTNNVDFHKLSMKIKFAFNKKPTNLYFQNFVDINVYRSLLKNARCLVYFSSYIIDQVQLFEAFASELQVFAFDSALSEEYKNLNILIHSDDFKDLLNMITDFMDYKISNTINKAFDYVLEYDSEELGKKLVEIYSSVEKGDNQNDRY